MECLERLTTYLREHRAPYQVQQHPAAFTAQEVAASEHVPGRFVAKAVVVLADAQKALLVLPATHQVNLVQAAQVLGAAEVRLAHEDEFAANFPDCEVGAVPPFGNLYGLPVYVDRSLTADDQIIFPAGTHTTTLSVAYPDFARLVQPVLLDFASAP
jgi:Ala-tRNA(Pro) deacylase